MIYLIGKTKVTYNQVSNWAKSKGAADCFFEFFPLLIEYANEYELDGGVLVAQAALETGFGKFPGKAVLDASFHNTCGLKTPRGGDSYEPESHTKFKNWNDGTKAHAQHMALYAGVEGFPLQNPIDPRHFRYRFACANTVDDLTGTWAEDPVYAEKITKLYNELINFGGGSEKNDNMIQELEEEIDEKNKLISELMDENDELKKKIQQIQQILEM